MKSRNPHKPTMSWRITGANTGVLLLGALMIMFVAVASCVTTGDSGHDATRPVGIDPAVSMATLPNGVVTYVRPNKLPENRIELRLVVKAGSVDEDDDQRGVAHFVEHMAFNGTANFRKQEIVNFLESVGMRFGPELNAYTSFDETVYILQLPADDEAVVEKGVAILLDWAGGILFEPEEVERERGIIVEEWRLGRGAEERIRDKQLPVLLAGSRYADRRPIGDIAVIQSCTPDTLRRFYDDWYRPENIAVIAVGDFERERMESMIASAFGALKGRNPKRAPVDKRVPSHSGTLYSIATDKEATSSFVNVYVKHSPRTVRTLGEYRESIVRYLFSGVLNARLDELAREPSAPFVNAYAGNTRFVATADFFVLGAVVKEGKLLDSLETVLVEAERIRRYGVTERELERQKKDILGWIESVYNEREKTESSSYVREYVYHFLEGEPVPGIAAEYEWYRLFLDRITVSEVNGQADRLLGRENRMIAIQGPEKKEAGIPDEPALARVIDGVAKLEIAPYVDTETEGPLLAETPLKGAVKGEKEIDAIGCTEIMFENGVRVVLKPTDFKSDEIVFSAYKAGGTSLADDADYVSAVTAPGIVSRSGVGNFTQTALAKILVGKNASVSFWNNEVYDGMNGSASRADIETLLTLVRLYMTSPRKDRDAFLAYKDSMRNELRNKSSSPESTFWDAVQSAINADHFRSRPWSEPMLDEIDLDTAYDFFRDRYGNAYGFTFVFVGSFRPEDLRPLLATYLGSLPSRKDDRTWTDRKSVPPQGPYERTVKKGIEPKSLVEIVYCGTTGWSFGSRFALGVLADVLDIDLREVVREKASGTYSISTYSEMYHYPHGGYNFFIGFGCAPKQIEPLTQLVYDEIESMKKNGPDDVHVKKVVEIRKRELEKNLKQNEYWMSNIQYHYLHGLDPVAILGYGKLIESITAESVRTTAASYLLPERRVRVTLVPEQ